MGKQKACFVVLVLTVCFLLRLPHIMCLETDGNDPKARRKLVIKEWNLWVSESSSDKGEVKIWSHRNIGVELAKVEVYLSKGCPCKVPLSSSQRSSPVREMPEWSPNRDRGDNWTLHILGFQLTQLDQINFMGTKAYFQSLFQRKGKKSLKKERKLEWESKGD